MFISASAAAAAPAEPLSEEQTPFSHTARGKMSQEKVDESQGQSKWWKGCGLNPRLHIPFKNNQV